MLTLDFLITNGVFKNIFLRQVARQGVSKMFQAQIEDTNAYGTVLKFGT